MTSSTKPRLLILTSSFPTGPEDETCAYIRDFARSLSSQFEVRVLAPPDDRACDWPADHFTLERSSSLLSGSKDLFQATRDFNNLPVRNIVALIGLSVSLILFLVKAFRLAARSDAVCSHWLVPAGAAGAAIAKLTGKPHIVVEHSGALHLLSGVRVGRSITRFVVSGSSRLVTVSEDLREKLVALCPGARTKTEVIPMGVQANEPAGLQPPFAPRHLGEGSSQPMILFIGRLTEVKGVDVLLSAMRLVNGARLVVAGDGEQRSRLEARARGLGVDVTFLGRVDASARRRLLQECDAVVIPSRVLANGRTEGSPVVCLEAMAAGRPVIAARVGGLAEMIADGQNGLLFEAGDELALAEKLNLLIGDSDLRAGLAANARVSAANHSWALIGLRFGGIIKASIGRNDRVLDDQELDGSFAGC